MSFKTQDPNWVLTVFMCPEPFIFLYDVRPFSREVRTYPIGRTLVRDRMSHRRAVIQSSSSQDLSLFCLGLSVSFITVFGMVTPGLGIFTTHVLLMRLQLTTVVYTVSII